MRTIYKHYVTLLNITVMFLFSNSIFCQTKIKVEYPDGGEKFAVGSTIDIRWSGVSEDTPVKLEYVSDDGKVRNTIVEKTSGLHFKWKVPSSMSPIRAPYKKYLIWASQLKNETIVMNGMNWPDNSPIWSSSGNNIFTGVYDSTISIWDVSSGKKILSLVNDREILFALWNKDGRRLATADSNGRIKVWDISTSSLLFTAENQPGLKYTIDWSPDGTKLLSSSSSGKAYIWDGQNGAALAVLSIPTGKPRVTNAVWSPDGSKVLGTVSDYSSSSTTAVIWDANTRELINTLGGYGEIRNALWSPDGKKIATTESVYRSARIWDAITGQSISVLVGHTGNVENVAWSNDSKKILTFTSDTTVRIWNPLNGTQLLKIPGHKDRIASAKWSPDDSKIVTASADRSARIWNSSTGKEILQLLGHTSVVNHASFSPDGKKIATYSGDKTTRIWDPEGTTVTNDLSNDFWEIQDPDNTSAKLINPNGGERYFSGDTITINWAGELTDTIRLRYSSDTGRSWKTITDNATNLEYLWSTSSIPEGSYLMQTQKQRTANDEWLWVNSLQGNGLQVVRNLTTDNHGNIYVIGDYSENMVFGEFDHLFNRGEWDIFFASYTSDGLLRWVERLGGRDYDFGKNIIYGRDGKIYITGHFSESITFGYKTTLTANTNGDFFLACYSTYGEFQWVKQGFTSDYEDISGICQNLQNEITIVGNIYNNTGVSKTVDIGNNIIFSSDNGNVFIASYSPEGKVLWGKQLGIGFDWVNSEQPYGIALDSSSNTYTLAHINGNKGDFEIGKGNIVASYTSKGIFRWAKPVLFQHPKTIVSSPNGRIYVTGSYTLPVTLPNGKKISPIGKQDLFLMCFNSLGTIEWAKTVGSASEWEVGYGLSLDRSGNLYLTGSISERADFGNGVILDSIDRSQRFFIAKFDSTGQTLWAKQAHTADVSSGSAIIVDEDNTIYVSGLYESKLGLEEGDIRLPTGKTDSFIAKYIHEGFVYSKPDISDSIWFIKTYVNSTPRNEHFTSPTLYPNPSGLTSIFQTSISHPGYARLVINDIFGNKVRIVFEGNHHQGIFKQTIELAALPAGIYFVDFQCNDERSLQSLSIIK